MARPSIPLDESIGGEIYDILLEFVDAKQTIPNAHAFWQNILVGQKGYAISRSGFEYWWLRLQIAGLIEIEPLTRSVRVKDVRLQKLDG